MKKITISLTVALFVSVLFLIACSSDKGPAEIAYKAAEQAVAATKAEAAKIAPDQVKALEDSLTAVKEKVIKKEYTAALQEAAALKAKAEEVATAVKAKKDELTKKWAEVSQELPKMVETLQAKVDTLSKARKLPAKMTKEKLAEAKAELDTIKNEWTKAEESFKSGAFNDAVNIATALKDKAAKIMESLGLAVPAPAAPVAATPVPVAAAPAPVAAAPVAAPAAAGKK
jgi:hypothetical protein